MSGSGSAPGDSVGPSALRQPEAQSSSLPKEGFFLVSPELRAAGDPSLEGAGHMAHATGRGQQETPQEARVRRGASQPPASGSSGDMPVGDRPNAEHSPQGQPPGEQGAESRVGRASVSCHTWSRR